MSEKRENLSDTFLEERLRAMCFYSRSRLSLILPENRVYLPTCSISIVLVDREQNLLASVLVRRLNDIPSNTSNTSKIITLFDHSVVFEIKKCVLNHRIRRSIPI